jgi:hypothetical protein
MALTLSPLPILGEGAGGRRLGAVTGDHGIRVVTGGSAPGPSPPPSPAAANPLSLFRG